MGGVADLSTSPSNIITGSSFLGEHRVALDKTMCALLPLTARDCHVIIFWT